MVRFVVQVWQNIGINMYAYCVFAWQNPDVINTERWVDPRTHAHHFP